MAEIRIPLIGSRFGLKASFLRVGDPSCSPVIVDAIIDTGASISAISHTIVAALGVSPDGIATPCNTASGTVFSRKYPLRVSLDDKIFKILSCGVVFHPVPFLDVCFKSLPTRDDFNKIINDCCSQNGLPLPDAYFAKQITATNGEFKFQTLIPGPGVDQNPCLIGMDLLSQFHWRFDRDIKAIIIDC